MKRNEQGYIEYAKRTGAVLTAAGASFLGGLSLKSAEAMPLATPNTTEQIDNTPVIPSHPKGVHVLNSRSEIMLENAIAYANLRHRLNVVVVLHHPKKDAVVTFASSPSSYVSYNTQEGFLYSDQKKAEEVDAPGFEIFKGRPVLVVGPDKKMASFSAPEAQVQWGWGDLKWFVENDAIDFYKYQGVKPGLVKYSPVENPENMPQITPHATVPKTKDIYAAPDANGRNRRVQLMSKQEVQKLLNQLTHRN